MISIKGRLCIIDPRECFFKKEQEGIIVTKSVYKSMKGKMLCFVPILLKLIQAARTNEFY